MNSVTSLKFAFLGVLVAAALWSRGSDSARAPSYEPAAPTVVGIPTAVGTEGGATDLLGLVHRSDRSDQSDQSDLSDSPAPEVGAASVFVQEVETGETLFARDTNMRRPIASLTKLMTATIAREYLAADETLTMSESAVAQEGIAGGFAEGERFTAGDLIAAALVVSSNDAAYALAEGATRSQSTNTSESTNAAVTFVDSDKLVGSDRFVSAMNAKARAIGMFETHFEDPTGLSPLNQSSAEDLGRLARYLLTYNRELLAITAAPKVFIRERTTGARRALSNINSFAGRSEFFGGKTGFTDEAAGNLLSVWQARLDSSASARPSRDGSARQARLDSSASARPSRDGSARQARGRTYLIIVLGTEDRFGDTEKLWQWISAQFD